MGIDVGPGSQNMVGIYVESNVDPDAVKVTFAEIDFDPSLLIVIWICARSDGDPNMGIVCMIDFVNVMSTNNSASSDFKEVFNLGNKFKLKDSTELRLVK